MATDRLNFNGLNDDTFIYKFKSGVFAILAIRLPPEAEVLLEDLAQRRGTDSKTVALRAILEYLEDEEDARIGGAALEEHYRTGGKTISMAEVARKFGLEATEATSATVKSQRKSKITS